MTVKIRCNRSKFHEHEWIIVEFDTGYIEVCAICGISKQSIRGGCGPGLWEARTGWLSRVARHCRESKLRDKRKYFCSGEI